MRTTARNIGLSVCFFGVISLTAPGRAQEKDKLPDGEGKALVQRICTGCHDLDTAVGENRTEAQWKAVVDTMVSRGAEGTDTELATVVKYLGKNFGKGDAK